MIAFSQEDLDKFWSYVTKTDHCWLWGKKKIPSECYGLFTTAMKDKSLPAHRASYMIHFGEIPSGMYVCHHCDTPSCVRPDHLFTGTPGDNMRDCSRKNRKQILSARRHAQTMNQFDIDDPSIPRSVAARMMRISIATLDGMISSGKIAAAKIGKRIVRLWHKDVLAYMENQSSTDLIQSPNKPLAAIDSNTGSL